MTLPAPNLDDLRFQADLVDEARKRIIRYCPEWTDYNVHDPGITLIELFAWLAEQMVYRLNRVPDKNYIKFLNLLGLQPKSASCARTELTFWLSVALPISPDNLQDVVVPQGQEVRSNTGEVEEMVFTTDRLLRIIPPELVQLQREKEINRNYLPRLGIETFYPFDQYHPRQGDAFYLGFNPQKDLSGHILRLSFTCEPTEAVGIRREDPPWVWECSVGNGIWRALQLSTFQDEKETTGGLNNPQGSLVLYLPLDAHPDLFHGREAYWVRCRLEQRHPSQGMYTESPRVTGIEASVLGATVPASHAQVIQQELLGTSSGEPGQEFALQHAPVLALQEGETLLVQEFQGGEYVLAPWQSVDSFAFSAPYDRHFLLDSAAGHVLLGPSIRQPDGSVRQYGRVPDSGRSLYFQRYRYGGGARGNLPVNALQTMASTVAYVARVTNLVRASGGQDQESIDEVKLRAQRELQAQKRAVTAQDFEQLVLNFSRSVARVRCLTPRLESKEVGVAQLVVVPAVGDALRAGDLTRLHLSDIFTQELTQYLDRYRLLTSHVRVCEPAYVGVKVRARVVVNEFSNPETVITRVDHHLRNFLNPLVPFPEQEEADQLLEKGWQGWPLGKDLFVAEIYSLIQRVPGVRYVMEVEIASRPVDPRSENLITVVQQPLTPLGDKVLWVSSDAQVCSLEHEVIPVDLAEYKEERR
jgi:predicted phage baseplate assembly protein